ncbi:ABC transporter ATP-binding protein [Aureimonas altamirensis]|uniref:ABC transporter ATP-binding protein n=1 Tax=Aureimonas altamirensis TaxID=370622 RepID=UPI001E460277|nr:ABC transporter ATP-binding protein [Aureimonas altamirensis]UHD46438.1 ABC transporter ATP-binding protein [Aureimonas altamirensis]
MTQPLLSIRDLQLAFQKDGEKTLALRGVDLDVAPGETVGLVGESGSGKSLTAFATMGLLPPSARVVSGSILFQGRDLLRIGEREFEGIRGNDLNMIFQEPMTALNPVMTIGAQISAPIRKHLNFSKAAARTRAIEQLAFVGIPDPTRRFDQFPHQLSGGMRQRVMIAMALGSDPKLLIADEPTTALDVTIQAQILELLRRLRNELNLAIVIITHDLGVIAELADRVCVMYGGRIVEKAPAGSLFDSPQHPYSQGLLSSTIDIEAPTQTRLRTIRGAVPHIADMPSGCAFHPRCPERLSICDSDVPSLERQTPERSVACWARNTA